VWSIQVHVSLSEAIQGRSEMSRISSPLRHLHSLLARVEGILEAPERPSRNRGVGVGDGRLGIAFLALQVGAHA
jgi:hypothetical protein